jgi:hypothetical protein
LKTEEERKVKECEGKRAKEKLKFKGVKRTGKFPGLKFPKAVPTCLSGKVRLELR